MNGNSLDMCILKCELKVNYILDFASFNAFQSWSIHVCVAESRREASAITEQLYKAKS